MLWSRQAGEMMDGHLQVVPAGVVVGQHGAVSGTPEPGEIMDSQRDQLMRRRAGPLPLRPVLIPSDIRAFRCCRHRATVDDRAASGNARGLKIEVSDSGGTISRSADSSSVRKSRTAERLFAPPLLHRQARAAYPEASPRRRCISASTAARISVLRLSPASRARSIAAMAPAGRRRAMTGSWPVAGRPTRRFGLEDFSLFMDYHRKFHLFDKICNTAIDDARQGV